MKFNRDFIWGAATAAYQVEGAVSEDGRGKSIWDVFSAVPGKVVNNQNGNVACDHYHRYKEDVGLLNKLGMNAYRFSVAWPRVMPEGFGRVNEKGLDFYDRLTDELLNQGIEPYITLYHWDMPYEIDKLGGFRNSEIANWFALYTDVVTRRLGDRCKNFITINEPQCVLNLGYKLGVHAPGYCLSDKEVFECVPNILLCHGRAAEIIRKNVKNSRLSLAACSENVYPDNDEPLLVKKTCAYNFEQPSIASLLWLLDPICKGEIPQVIAEKFPEAFDKLTSDDMKLISKPIDYIGFNIYTALSMVLNEKGGLTEKEPYPGYPVTSMGWRVNEECMYWMTKFIYERYKLPIVISENGMANNDWVCLDGKIHDELRADYLERHIRAVGKAMEEGADVRGYFVWSLLDNFEWSAGYEKRFGLVYVDYRTQKRTIKESGYRLRDFIQKNRNQAD